MEALSKYCGNVVQHYQYEKKSIPVKAADLFLLFTVTFPLIGKTHTYNHQERTFTEHRLALFEIRDPVTKAFEVFLRVVAAAAALYLAATSLSFILLLNAALLIKFASSENKRTHQLFLEGQKHTLKPVLHEPLFYSNKEYRLDGKVVESLPFSYYERLGPLYRGIGPCTKSEKVEEGRTIIREVRATGTYQEEHRNDVEKTIDYTLTCEIDNHCVELQYSTNEIQRLYKENLKDEERRNTEWSVDGLRIERGQIPNGYIEKINEMIVKHVDSDMLNIERQMKEGVPIISIRWTAGSIQFMKKEDTYTSTLGVSVEGRHILIKRTHNPNTFSVFNS